MMQLSSKNDDLSLCYDVIITHQNLKNDNLVIFRTISNITVRHTHLERLPPTWCWGGGRGGHCPPTFYHHWV